MDISDRAEVWSRIESELDSGLDLWRDQIVSMEQIPAIERRESGETWTDGEVFEALVLSVLTNSVDWSRIQAIRHELKDCFCAFDPVSYASLSAGDVQDRLVPWFKARKAGALNHRQSFTLLIEAARQLIDRKADGTIDEYIGRLYEDCGQSPVELTALLGSEKTHKLRGIGIPLAAEFLKNLGYDVAKPDRHICRAVGAFGWVKFKNWPDQSGNKAPWPSEKEMVDVMRAMDCLATSVGQRTAFVDNALWLLCAKSGLRASNVELGRLGQPESEEADPHGQRSSLNDAPIAPERADRFTWNEGDVEVLSHEQFEAGLDRMYGKGNRPGVNGFMG